MMLLHFSDPTKLHTKKIVFEEVYNACDPGTLEQLKELSSKRRAIEESTNKSSSVTEAIAREMSGGLTSRWHQDLRKLEHYLPLLENLIFNVNLVQENSQMVKRTSNLKIRWTSALSLPSFFDRIGSKFIQIDSLQFELSMNLFLYGALLRERALEVMPEDMKQSVTLFREAAGIYNYLAQKVLLSLQPVLGAVRLPETNPSVAGAMSLICLAEAQAVTVRKAEEKGNSGGLLAKLHYGVAQFLYEAIGVLRSGTGGCKEISLRFMDFISSCKALHELRSQKYFAEGLKLEEKLGAAIGILRLTLINVKKKTPQCESWNSVFKQEIDSVSDMLKKLEHENEFVWRQKVPVADQLPLLEGMKMATSLDYKPQRWERELNLKL